MFFGPLRESAAALSYVSTNIFLKLLTPPSLIKTFNADCFVDYIIDATPRRTFVILVSETPPSSAGKIFDVDIP